MPRKRSKPQYSTIYTQDQLRALDTIGVALKRRRINFQTASDLGDAVKAGRVGVAINRLERIEGRNSNRIQRGAKASYLPGWEPDDQ